MNKPLILFTEAKTLIFSRSRQPRVWIRNIVTLIINICLPIYASSGMGAMASKPRSPAEPFKQGLSKISFLLLW